MSNCCLKSEDNTAEVMMMQLRREIKQLSKDTTARLLIQDKKIADTCVYIKNNLSNEIRNLLDTMQHTGELDEIITETLLGEVALLQSQVEYVALRNEEGVINLQYPYGHVKRYGAQGDGVTDDTKAIQTAARNAITHSFPLLADEGVYIVSEDINMRYIRYIDFKGDINSSGIIGIGNSSAEGSGSVIKFSKVNSLEIIGLKNSIIEFKYCDSLSLYADGDDSTASSTAYCQISGAYCKKITIHSEGDAIGWINENVFRIKRIEEISMTGNYEHNNNHFEHCNLEKGALNFESARNNYISARCEGGVTIKDAVTAGTNFIEKEYYYKHYFGEDVVETSNGTLTYFPVNKLQTERELYRIDASNRSFPIGSVLFNADDTFKGVEYNQIFRSNLIKIDNTFALKMKGSHAGLRVQLNFYDENKNRITGEVDNFADGKMSFVSGGEWSYVIGSNVNNDTVVFFAGAAKYVEYRVIFGDGVEDVDFEFVKIKLLKYINTDIHVFNTLENDVYTQVPTAGYWKRGHKLYAKNPTAGTYIGIICVEEGNPARWKNFGQIQEGE